MSGGAHNKVAAPMAPAARVADYARSEVLPAASLLLLLSIIILLLLLLGLISGLRISH